MLIGTWNLDRSTPHWRHDLQLAHVHGVADLWLLTEVPADFDDKKDDIVFSALRPDDPGQHWSAIWSKWPLKRIPQGHPSLVMARVNHPDGAFLAASSVFPWRGAAKYWPTEDGDSFAERCTRTLAAHEAEITSAHGKLPVVWGGDFNQGLSGQEYVGSKVGRDSLLAALGRLGLNAVTDCAEGQNPLVASIDHLAVPNGWASGAVRVERPRKERGFLSDHPSYAVPLTLGHDS